MNIRKIIKYIAEIGMISGIAYIAYKIGENDGADRERIRSSYDESREYEDLPFEYTEPDDGCIAPKRKQKSL